MDLYEHNTNLKEVKRSHGRCLLDPDFFNIFYEKFIQSSPEIASYFKDTDGERLQKVLKHGLSCIIMYAGGNKAGALYLERVGKHHSQNQLNISPELYKYWKTSFLEAAATSDPEMDLFTIRAWHEVIDGAIANISSSHIIDE